MLQYVCGHGRTGRRDAGDEHAGVDSQNYGVDRELQCQAAFGADAGVARYLHVGKSVRADGGKGTVVSVPAACSTQAAPGIRIHGLPSEHHRKGLLQRYGVCVRQTAGD